MIKILYSLFILLFPIYLFGESWIDSRIEDERNLQERSIKNEILLEVQEKLYEQYWNTVSAANEISNKWLTYQTIILTIFSIILVIFVVYIWWIVNSRLSSIEKIKNDVDKIWNEISNTPELFFQRMRDFELDYIFERLSEFDIKDINHFNWILNTRVIPYKYADRFIEVYDNALELKSVHRTNILQLLVLHFPDRVYLNDSLWRDFIWDFFSLYSNFYNKEVEIIVEKIVKVYSNKIDSKEKIDQLLDKVDKISDPEKKEFWLWQINLNLAKFNIK